MPYKKIIFLFFLAFASYNCTNEKEQANGKQGNSSIALDSAAITKKLLYENSYDASLTLFPIPFEEKWIKTTNGNAHVIIAGPASAEPLILLHGMNASSTMWYPNIKSLSENHRIYAIDFLLEPGKSEYIGEIKNTEGIVNWYHEIFNELGLEEFILVGASRGGWLAINIALREKMRVLKIVLLSPAQTFIWIRNGPKFMTNIMYSLSPKRKKLRNVLETMTHDVDKISQIYIDQYYLATTDAPIDQFILQMSPFSNSELESLTMPVLLLIGDNDIINNKRSINQANKLVPLIETETIKNAGHFLSIDQPEIVDQIILNFLNKERAPILLKK